MDKIKEILKPEQLTRIQELATQWRGALALADHKIAEAYGVWKEKSMYGRKYMGIERTTFLVDADGKIAKIFPKVKPEGHAEKVLEALS